MGILWRCQTRISRSISRKDIGDNLIEHYWCRRSIREWLRIYCRSWEKVGCSIKTRTKAHKARTSSAYMQLSSNPHIAVIPMHSRSFDGRLNQKEWGSEYDSSERLSKQCLSRWKAKRGHGIIVRQGADSWAKKSKAMIEIQDWQWDKVTEDEDVLHPWDITEDEAGATILRRLKL